MVVGSANDLGVVKINAVDRIFVASEGLDALISGKSHVKRVSEKHKGHDEEKVEQEGKNKKQSKYKEKGRVKRDEGLGTEKYDRER